MLPTLEHYRYYELLVHNCINWYWLNWYLQYYFYTSLSDCWKMPTIWNHFWWMVCRCLFRTTCYVQSHPLVERGNYDSLPSLILAQNGAPIFQDSFWSRARGWCFSIRLRLWNWRASCLQLYKEPNWWGSTSEKNMYIKVYDYIYTYAFECKWQSMCTPVCHNAACSARNRVSFLYH